jgi:hypothetical protein
MLCLQIHWYVLKTSEEEYLINAIKKTLEGDARMGNGDHGGTSSTLRDPNSGRLGLASIGAITGGSLLAINNIWQGYLDVTPGNDGILHDVTHYAYYLNNSMLFLAMCGLLLGLYGLNNRVTAAKQDLCGEQGSFFQDSDRGFLQLGH